MVEIDDINKYEHYGLLLNKIMDTHSINYCIDGNTPAFGFEKLNDLITNYDYSYQINQPSSSQKKEKKQNIFEYWLSGTWAEIEKAGRQKDFADLKEALTSPVKMNFQQCSTTNFVGLKHILSDTSGRKNYIFSDNKEDIRFIFYTGTENYKDVLGEKYSGIFRVGVKKGHIYLPVYSISSPALKYYLFALENLPPLIIVKSEKMDLNFYRIIAHETGHSLGMADTYPDSDNASKKYRTSRYPNALMDSGPQLTCDDADGLINLIDRLNGYERGGKKGWRGLCKGYYRLYKNSNPAIDLTEMKISLDQAKEAIRKNFENLRFDW